MIWQILIANQAKKNLARLPKDRADRLLLALDEIVVDPYFGDIKKVKGELDTWRRRVGRYRITYAVFVIEKIIKVTDMEIKSDNTYKF